MKHVLVTVPTAPANMFIHKECVFALLKLQQDVRHKVRIVLPSHNPFENNLHHCVNTFLAKDYDYWLSFDYDNPPIENPLDLIEFDRDVIACPTPIWHHKGLKGERPMYWSAYKYVPESDAYTEWPTKEGLQKVDAIGTGCFLAARRVFLHEDLQKGAFTRKLNKDGTVERGNDISFSERARKAGFELYAHFDYPCDHFKNMSLNDVALAINQMCKEGNNG